MTESNRSGLQWLVQAGGLAGDFRSTWRALLRRPGFTCVAVLVLGLGLGVVSTTFTLVNAVALKPLMITDPEDLVGIFAESTKAPRSYRSFSYPEYVAIRDGTESLSEVAAHAVVSAGIGEGDFARRVEVHTISANYFRTLGVQLPLGRAFSLAEEQGVEAPTVIVSHDYWERNGASPDLLGSTIRVNGEEVVVVGVAPDGFTGTTALFSAELWMPLASLERLRQSREERQVRLQDPRNYSLMLFGRMQEGVSATEVTGELAALARRSDANLPQRDGSTFSYMTAPMARLAIANQPETDGPLVGYSVFLVALSAVVLLIACVNLANMFLARGMERRTEMAIRQSLGSGRLRLIRQMLIEGLLLAFAGGAVGLLLAYFSSTWIAASLGQAVSSDWHFHVETRPDWAVLLVTVAGSVIATVLFGAYPAWRVTRLDLFNVLKKGAGDLALGGRKGGTLLSTRGLMIMAQIALSFVMLTSGALFLKATIAAAQSTPGFPLEGSLLVELDPDLVGYDETRAREIYSTVLERLRTLPQVESASLASLVPFGPAQDTRFIQPAGLRLRENSALAHYVVVSDEYFESLGLPMLRGREFTPSEADSGRVGNRVAIIDEGLASRLFPRGDAVGQQVQFVLRTPDEEPITMEIVGLARGVKQRMGGEPASRSPHIYVPFGQDYESTMYIHLRIQEGANERAMLETVRNEIRLVDPALPIVTLTTMREFLDQTLELWAVRTAATFFMALGGAAFFVALVGIYGIKAFLMSTRTREIGVRMALGATQAMVMRRMMRQSMMLTAVGLGVGLVLALGVGRVLSSLLFEVSATDPMAFAAASACLALGAVGASWLPVRRAVAKEPVTTLRHE